MTPQDFSDDVCRCARCSGYVVNTAPDVERAFDRIKRGLDDALAFAAGDETRGRLYVPRAVQPEERGGRKG